MQKHPGEFRFGRAFRYPARYCKRKVRFGKKNLVNIYLCKNKDSKL